MNGRGSMRELTARRDILRDAARTRTPHPRQHRRKKKILHPPTRVRDDRQQLFPKLVMMRCMRRERQRLVPFCSMKVRASITVRKPPREPSILVSALE